MEATTPEPSGPRSAPIVQLDPQARTKVLIAILLGLFLSALDQTIVGTALPRIVTDLRGNELYTWVVTIYLLTATVTGPIYGKLSDLFGRRPMLLIGVGLFLLGSFLSGLSMEMWQLILFRGIQGLGAGAIFPIALAVIGDLFTPAERGKYQGLFGAVFGISALIGPALGGFLTDQVSWHWVFFVNLPIGAVVMVVIARLLPTIKRPDASRNIDYLGVLVFTLAVVPILIGLTNKQSADWTEPYVGGFILLGLALTVVFLFIESRAAEPIVPLSLFRNRTFALSMGAVFLGSIGFFGAIVFLPLWFQVVQGASATASGYQMLPLLAGLIGSSIVSGAVVSRTGRYKAVTVGALLVVAFGLFLITNLRADTPLPVVWLWMFITGVGIGPTLAVFTIIVQNAVPLDKLGVATGNLTLFRQIGGTVGLSLAFSIFASILAEEIPGRLTTAGVPPQFVSQFANNSAFSSADLTSVGGDLGATILAQVPAQARPLVEPLIPNIVAGLYDAISYSIGASQWLGVAAALLAAGLTAMLREVSLRRTAAAPSGASQATGRPVEATALD